MHAPPLYVQVCKVSYRLETCAIGRAHSLYCRPLCSGTLPPSFPTPLRSSGPWLSNLIVKRELTPTGHASLATRSLLPHPPTSPCTSVGSSVDPVTCTTARRLRTNAVRIPLSTLLLGPCSGSRLSHHPTHLRPRRFHGCVVPNAAGRVNSFQRQLVGSLCCDAVNASRSFSSPSRPSSSTRSPFLSSTCRSFLGVVSPIPHLSRRRTCYRSSNLSDSFVYSCQPGALLCMPYIIACNTTRRAFASHCTTVDYAGRGCFLSSYVELSNLFFSAHIPTTHMVPHMVSFGGLSGRQALERG